MNQDLPTHLDRLGDLFESEFGWCQDADARTFSGSEVAYHSDKAASFSLEGGIFKMEKDFDATLRGVTRRALARTLTLEDDVFTRFSEADLSDLSDWNDYEYRTKKQVVKLCRDTAQRLRAA